MKHLLLIALAFIAAPVYSQTTFTVEQSSTDGKTVVPRLTWSTSPVATSCAATGGWSGTKAAAGTEILPAISISTSYTITCSWAGDLTARLTWSAPSTNTDGSALTNLAGYTIVYGKSATNLDQSAIEADPSHLTWTSPALAAGTWYFAVRAFNAQGLESPNSNVASKVLTGATSQARTLEAVIKIPNAPTGAAAK